MITTGNPLTASELEEILAIWFTANCEDHPFIPESYWRENLAFVREQLPQADLYLYKKNGKIIAFLGIKETYIAGLFVTSNQRNQGVGQQLLNEAKRIYPSLTLSVYAKNQQALTFYLRQGFHQVNEQVDTTGEIEYQLAWSK